MGRITYDIPEVRKIVWLPGNAGTAQILTPQAGTGSETKTHTTTLNPFYFGGMKVKIKRLQYAVTTAQTGTGCNLALDIYNGTSSVGSLSVTTQTAGAVVQSSSDIDSTVESTGYIRLYAKSTTTGSDANSAKGMIYVTYAEEFTT